MSILIDKNSKVIVQGITGRDGSFHTRSMLEYGTSVVGGVTPGKGGLSVEGLPVFNSVPEAVENTGADCSIIFVPAQFAGKAVREAVDGGIHLIVCITEGIPVNEMLFLYHYVKESGARVAGSARGARGARLIGPNCPGLISPGKSKLGIMPGHIHREGSVGVISRSGTLTYEVVYNLTNKNLGQSTCIGIGGDPIIGTHYIELLEMFEKDSETDSIVLIGEIGGEDEENAAEYIKNNINKRVVSFISGRTAPPGKKMGHAGAIISGGKGTAEAKVNALENAGVIVVDKPDQIPRALNA